MKLLTLLIMGFTINAHAVGVNKTYSQKRGNVDFKILTPNSDALETLQSRWSYLGHAENINTTQLYTQGDLTIEVESLKAKPKNVIKTFSLFSQYDKDYDETNYFWSTPTKCNIEQNFIYDTFIIEPSAFNELTYIPLIVCGERNIQPSYIYYQDTETITYLTVVTFDSNNLTFKPNIMVYKKVDDFETLPEDEISSFF